MTQKADAVRANLLAACLGPEMLGQPVVGQFERPKGGLIIVATDGVADRVTTQFAEEFIGYAQGAGGDLTLACETVTIGAAIWCIMQEDRSSGVTGPRPSRNRAI